MKINWVGVLKSLDPLYICRRYYVAYGDYCGGTAKQFWHLKKAELFYDSVVANNSCPFVSLFDTWVQPKTPVMWCSDGSNPTLLLSYKDKNAKPPMRYV